MDRVPPLLQFLTPSELWQLPGRCSRSAGHPRKAGDRDLKLAFGEEKSFPPYQQRRYCEQLDEHCAWNKSRGRLDYRHRSSTTWLNDYLDWPHGGQVSRCLRWWIVGGEETQ